MAIKASDVEVLDNQTKFIYRNEYLRFLIDKYILNNNFDTYTISNLYNYSIKTKKDVTKSINIDNETKEIFSDFINEIKQKYGIKLTYATLVHYAISKDLEVCKND